MFETIGVSYWVPSAEIEKFVGIKHGTSYEYSIEKQREIIDGALSKGLSTMLRPLPGKTLLILIDKGRFRQS